MKRIVLYLFCLISFFVTPAAAEYPPEFQKAYRTYSELMEQDKVREAIPYARTSLNIALKSNAFNDETRGKLAFNLGYALYLDNQLSSSAEAFGQAIGLFDKAGGSRKLKADARYYRGTAFHGLMRYEDAQSELEQALALLTGEGREEQLARAEILEALVWVEISLLRSQVAADYAAEAHSILEKLLGERHPRTLYSLLALSAANYKRGHRPKAREQLARALELADKAAIVEPGAERGPAQFTRWEFIQFHRRAALLYTIMSKPEDAEHHRNIVAGLLEGIPPPNLLVTPVKRTPPAYPPRALRAHQIGWVLVEYTVRPDGLTADIRIVDSAPGDVFDATVLEAVKTWEFKPQIENGEAVETRNVRTMIQFRLIR